MAESDSGGPSGDASPRSGSLAIHVYQLGEAEMLAVSGEVDHTTIAELREEIDRCLKGAPPMFVLDLTGVSFFSSVGLSALVATKDSAGQNTVFRVVANHRAVLRPLKATALDEVLSVFPSVDEAVS